MRIFPALMGLAMAAVPGDFLTAVREGNETLARELGAKLVQESSARPAVNVCASHDACRVGLLAWLVESGFSLEEKDEQGDTALLIAVGEGALQKTEWLLKHGANAFAVNALGESALHIAVDRLRVGRAPGRTLADREAILRKLADIRELRGKKDSQGRTPLALARYLHDHPGEWGSGVTKLSFREALRVLR